MVWSPRSADHKAFIIAKIDNRLLNIYYVSDTKFNVLYACSPLNCFTLYNNNLWLVLLLSLFHCWKKWRLESVSECSWPCGRKDRCRDRSYPSIPSWTWWENPSPVTKSLNCEPSEVGFQVHCYVKKALCRRSEWNPDTEKSRDKDGEKEFGWHSKPQLWVPASLREARSKSAFVIGPLGQSYHAVFTHHAILRPDITIVTGIWEPTIGPLGLLWSTSHL